MLADLLLSPSTLVTNFPFYIKKQITAAKSLDNGLTPDKNKE